MSVSVSFTTYYTDGNCSKPYYVYAEADYDCTAYGVQSACAEAVFGSGKVFSTASCSSDSRADVLALFGDTPFIAYDKYDESSCTNLAKTVAYVATDTCIPTYINESHLAKVYADGKIADEFYNTSEDCSSDAQEYFVQADALAKHTCLTYGGTNGYVYYTVDSASGSGGLSTGALVGIVVGAVAAALVVGGLAFWYVRRKRKYNEATHQQELLEAGHLEKDKEDPMGPFSMQPTLASTRRSSSAAWLTSRMSMTMDGGPMLWEDEVIIGARVPREKVMLDVLISRGGYGEVYKGSYNGYDVAIKMLLPETRRSLKHVNAFLSEVRMMAALEHASIVQFVGVAWDSLNDLCVLSEYMAGGDLRALLVQFEEENHPKGFDLTKVKIACDIAHALTYLHSLEQPIIHRDLKSKNVLLDHELNAKLTDFGVSREREDRTMTAGVGTSLWMAPEVMMGEQYDHNADIFSFGVMLSELDVHTLPYSHAKENSTTGRKMPDAAVLQMVALGNLRVEFSEGAMPEVVELGLACVSRNPKDRPTSAEALYKLHKILQQLKAA